MKNSSLLLILLTVSFLAVAQPKGYKKTPSGLVYKILIDKPGDVAKKGDIVKFHFIMKTDKDSLLRNTYKEPNPLEMLVRDGAYKGSLEEGFQLMSVGDSVSFLVSADSMFKGNMPPFIKVGSSVNFTIKLLSALSEEAYRKEQDKINAEMIGKEDITLQEYIKQNNLKATKTASGLYYVQTLAGTGAQAEKGKTVSVHYTGKLLNGTKFDSSVDRGTPFEFLLGQGQVIGGWDEGIALMKVGEKGTLLIPSTLGYGARGAGGSIPPNSILIFDVELLGIK